MVSSTRGEIVTTALLLGALVAIVGSLLGAGSQILNSNAYAPVPRVERTAQKTTLEVRAISADQISITGNLCFGAGLGSGIEKITMWASDDPPGKRVLSNVLPMTLNGGSGDYPAPCIKPDIEGDAILTNANATPSRMFNLTAKLSAPLTDTCVNVYLHLTSNRQGRWPNFRRFTVNKNGLCASSTSVTPVPSTSIVPTQLISNTITPSIRPSDGPTLTQTLTPTQGPGRCGQSCSQQQPCSPELTCVTDVCGPNNPRCVPRSICLDLDNPLNPQCRRPTVTPSPTPTLPIPCRNPNRPTCSVPTRTPTRVASPTPIACIENAPGWLDNNRSKFIASAWAKKHQYTDCPSDSSGTWPTSVFDCLIPDQGSGPSTADKVTVKEPTPLYYKHLTPFELFTIITLDNTRTLQQAADDDFKKIIRDAIVTAVKRNPQRFSDVSFDSVSAGLEPANKDGEIIRSTSLWVHPVVETIITDAITVRERARLFYQPYIEGAVGQKVSTDDVEDLYTAALNHCGSSAQGGVQSGLGVKKVFGEYTAVVQNWSGGGADDDIFSDVRDCNIHIVRTTQCIPSPTATQQPTPTTNSKPNISGKITVKTCVAPEVMYVNRCEKGGSKADCKDVVQEDLTRQVPAEDSIWFNKSESDASKNTYVFNYLVTSDSQHVPLEEGANYQVPLSLMKIGLRGYFSQRDLTPVTATGTRDFVINATENCAAPSGAPTLTPTGAPRCIFNPVSFIKIRENGSERFFTEAGNDATQWGTMNDKRIKKLGDSTFFRTPFSSDGRHMPCGEAGCDLTGRHWCCVDDNDTPADSYDLTKKPYDIASVYLYYPKDKFKIVKKCDKNGDCIDVSETDVNANRIDQLPIGCNQEYTYGWVVERKPAASCKLTDKCEPTITEVVRDKNPDSPTYGETPASKVKIEWDKPAIGCEYTGYTMEVVEPTGNGIVVCRAFTDAEDDSTTCHLEHDEPLSKVGAVTGHTWKRYITYTINLYATSHEAPDCRSKAGSWKFSRDSDEGRTEPEPTEKEYNTFALNLYDEDEFEEGGANHLCWTTGNNDGPPDNVRGSEQNGFSCTGKVSRNNKGHVKQIELCYQNKKGDTATMSWQVARCEASSTNCQQPIEGPDGDNKGGTELENGKWTKATWDVSSIKPTKVAVETNLDSCLGMQNAQEDTQQVIPPFPPSRFLAPQGVAPVGYALGYPDYQRTDDGKLVLNGIYINDITQSPISTDSEGNLVIAQEPDYRISFLPKHDGQFLIDVLGSPFEESRIKAEDDFVQLLGIDKPDACWLYTVESTTDTVDPESSKKNHMLSFCEYRLRADINGDTVINGIDYALLAQAVISGQYNEATDINQDGANDGLDTSIMVDNFGRKVE